MSIKSRLKQLEQKQPVKDEGHQIAIFIVTPRTEPKGYVCEGITILREPGESVEALRQRARQMVAWPPGTSRKIFDCLD